jgi:hypothetical protein
MALRFIDSFDHYQTAQITSKWSTLSTPGAHTIVEDVGRCDTNALRVGGGAGISLVKGLPFAGSMGIAGFAFQVTEQTTSAGTFFQVLTAGAGFVTLSLARLLDGAIRIQRQDLTPVTLATTAPDTVRVGNWYYLELRWVLSNTVGEIQFRVNGVEIVTLTGIDTVANAAGTSTTPSGIILLCSANINYLVDDLYVLDDAGGAPNNAFLGDTRVEYLRPTAAGFHQDWALVGKPSHWEAVDDGDSPDGDTSYIHTATAGEHDTELYENTGLPSGTIFGVQIGLYARKTDSGFREVAPLIRHAGTTYSGASQPPSFASYLYLLELFETNPGTGLAWTIPDVNNAEFGVRLAL